MKYDLRDAINKNFLAAMNEALYGVAKQTGVEFYAYGFVVEALPTGEFRASFKFQEKGE